MAKQRSEHGVRDSHPPVPTYDGEEAVSGDHPHAGADQVEDDQRRGGDTEHRQQLVAVLRPEDRVGGDPSGVVIREPREDARADDGEQGGQVPGAGERRTTTQDPRMGIAARSPAWVPAMKSRGLFPALRDKRGA